MRITSESMFKTDVFDVVGKIPKGFSVWNIGKNMMHDDYIPICEDLRPTDKENFEIKKSTLKAIKLPVDEVMKLRDAASYGVNSLETARKALRSKRTSRMAEEKRKHATMTIDIFERITE